MKKEKIQKESYAKTWNSIYGGTWGTLLCMVLVGAAGTLTGGSVGHFADIHDDGNPDPAVQNNIRAELQENIKSLVGMERGVLAAEALLQEKMPAQILLGLSNTETRQMADRNLAAAKAEFEAARTAFSVRLLTDMHIGERDAREMSEEAIKKLSTKFPAFYQLSEDTKETTAFYSRGLRECQREILASPEKYKVSYGSNVKTAEAVSICSVTDGTDNIDIGIQAGFALSLMAIFAAPALFRREIPKTPVKAVTETVFTPPPAEEKPKTKLRLES